MDSDDKFIGKILTRRDALRAAALAGFSVVFGSRSEAKETQESSVNLVATPGVEEGPFFVDEGLNRKDVTQGTTRETVANGSPLALHITVHAFRGEKSEPLKDVHVDIWHADAKGTYSDEASGDIQSENTKGEKWLRGYQVTGSDGRVEFRTIYPGWYQGRTPHIHVKIRTYNAQSNKTHEFNTQLFFEEEVNDAMLGRAPYGDRGPRRVRNVWDGLYSMKQADGTMVGSHLHWDVERGPDGIVHDASFALALKLD